jgi:uncharacterized protein YndB with AHSA1/START domain
MGKAWEHHEEAELDATPEQVWQAIATGPGIDSWFMGRSSVEPGVGGTVHTDVGTFVMDSTVTAWEPGKRLAYRSDQGGGRFIAYAYLTHFAGRTGTAFGVTGPAIADWPVARATLSRAMGAGDDPAVGDRVRFTPAGLAAVDGVVDFVNPDAIGIRTDDALYRFICGFFGPIEAQHHIFRADVDPQRTGQAWQDWLGRVLG